MYLIIIKFYSPTDMEFPDWNFH